MTSVVSIAIGARHTGAAAFASARSQTAALGRAVQGLSRQFTAQHRTVVALSGAYQDANGRWRTATGQFVAANTATRRQTTALGHLVNVGRGAGRVMGALGRTIGNLASSAGEGAAALAPLAGKIALITALALPAVAALADLSGLIALAAPAAVAGGAAMVVFKMGLSGIADAFKAGLSGDMEEFHRILAKMPPAAREFAISGVQIAKAWRPVQTAVQQALFGSGNLPHEIRQLSIELKPIALRWLPAIAALFSDAAKSAADFLEKGENLQKINDILGATKATIEAGLPILGSFGRIFFDTASTAAPRLTIVTELIAKMVDKFADFVQKSSESGSMGGWIDTAISAGKQFFAILGQIGRLIGAVFKAGEGQGQSFLGTIEDLIKKWADFMLSPEGQTFIKMIGAIGIAIYKLAGIIPEVLNAIRPAINIWQQFILGAFALIIVGAAKAFGWIPGIGPKLQNAANDFLNFRNQVNRALDGIEDETVNVTVRYREVGRSLGISNDFSSGIGGRAAGGPTSMGLTRINERGDEMVRLPTGSMVYPSGQSQRMMREVGGASRAETRIILAARPGSQHDAASMVVDWINRGVLRLVDGDGRLISVQGG